MEDSGASSGVTTVEHGGMTLTTTGVPEADVKASLKVESTDGETTEKKPKAEKRTPSDAGRELGKLGGKAAAEKRAAEAKEAKPAEKPEAKPETADDEGDGPAAEDDDEEDIKSPRVKRRIEKATRQAAEAKRALEAVTRERETERARYEARLAAAEQGRPRGAAEARDGAGERREGPARDDSEKPQEKDFESYEEYLDARDHWNRGEWTREQERKEHGERVRSTMKSHVDTFVGALNEHPGLYDELDPSLVTVAPYFFMSPDAQVTPDNLLMAEIVFAGKQGPKILKYLSEQPEALKYLRSLQAHEDIRVEVKYLARVLGSKPDATAGDPPGDGDRAPKREASKATPPVRPVSGAPHIAEGNGSPREDEDFDGWYRRQKRA